MSTANVSWETVLDIGSSYDKIHTERAKVKGGWLVRSVSLEGHREMSVAMTFMPDEHHLWGSEDHEFY